MHQGFVAQVLLSHHDFFLAFTQRFSSCFYTTIFVLHSHDDFLLLSHDDLRLAFTRRSSFLLSHDNLRLAFTRQSSFLLTRQSSSCFHTTTKLASLRSCFHILKRTI